MSHDEIVLIYSTWPDTATATAAGRALVEKRIAACANILPAMTSVYRWEGRIETGSEAVMVIKTRALLADEAIAAARELHPYEVPAFVTLPARGGHGPYLDWILAETPLAN
ncbi:MAG: divalent cation tolerance protein CutA [Hyphomicrobiales bacterium]|nr:divalent cation tolerance protein CutA [Hyphomicrobiales bacterium]